MVLLPAPFTPTTAWVSPAGRKERLPDHCPGRSVRSRPWTPSDPVMWSPTGMT